MDARRTTVARLRWEVTDVNPSGAEPQGGGAPAEPESGQLPLFGPGPEREVGRGEFRGLEFVHVRARTIVNRVDLRSPVPFRYTINAYRGCSHACTYCFARPTHEYLGLDPSSEFDRVIVVKVNAVERLRVELAPSRW